MKFIKSLINNNIPVKLLSFILLAFTMQSCEDNPNDLGFSFIPSGDTTLTRFLDSEADTMNITSSNYKQFINTFGSQNLLVGNYQGYTSKSLLKFTSINNDLDSATVISAILTLTYNNYFFKDEMGLTSFNIYQVNNNFNYKSVTYDSITSSSIGNISMGSYSGIPRDTQTINITLNNQFVKNWLEYAADTAYSVKNYGMILQPDMSSNTIKGFCSFNNLENLVPYVNIIYSKNNVTDTIKINISDYVSLSDAPSSIIPGEKFILQNGVAYRDMMRFDLTKLPSNVIINNVNLILYLDKANSFISGTTDKRLVARMLLDSVTKTDTITTEIFALDSSTYSISSGVFNGVFQRWNSGVLPNLGITLKNYYEIQNLDNFIFFSPSATDVTKRPRLKITYTPRN